MMYLHFVHCGYFLLFCVLKPSAGRTISAKTGSTIPFSTDYWNLEGTCKEDIEVFFLPIAGETKEEKKMLTLNAAEDGYCHLDIVAGYKQRMYVSNTGGRTSLPNSLDLSINLQHVSFQDIGKYYATRTRNVTGEFILFVSDKRVETRVGEKMDLHLVLSPSAYQESVLIGFYSGYMEPVGILLNPSQSHYVVSVFERWFVKFIGNTISISLESVQFVDQGLYFLEGRRTGNIYDSVISNVIGEPDRTTEIDTERSGTTASRNNEEKYFISGGAVGGIVLVAILCIVIYKGYCRRRMEPRSDATGDEANELDNIHHYSSIRNLDQCVSDSITTTGKYDPISEDRIIITRAIEMRDESGCDNIINVSSTNRSEIDYITPY